MEWNYYTVNHDVCITKLYSFFKLKINKGYFFKGETHNFWECMYVLSGSVIVSADERVYNLTEGEIIFHKPMELHKFHIEENLGATLIIFSLSSKGTLLSLFKDKVFKLSQQQKNIFDSLLSYIDCKTKLIPNINEINDYEKCFAPIAVCPTYLQTISTYIELLLIFLAENGYVAQTYESAETLIFKTAVNHMNSNISSAFSVSEIADFCNISESGLKRIFIKYSGIGVHRYFLNIKLKCASELLKSDMSVTEVAEKLGFSSQAYFSTVYKRETGMNPSSIASKA